MLDWTAIVVALVAMVGTGLGSVYGIKKSNNLIEDRMDKLEEKVDKHNNLVEKMHRAEIELSLRLKEYAATLKGREQLAVTKFAEALEIVPKTLAENAGYDAIDKAVELKSQHEKNRNSGIDAYSGEIKDMLKQGVVEPLRVKIQAIQSATDATCLILRIDDVLASTKKPPERAPGGMPPGMGGMGGMGGMPGMGGMGGMPPGMF